ncbi:DUF2961 domain-containing protein, partial [bacterium]|nr:DUF2961 domain-containing protein [bacterium]
MGSRTATVVVLAALILIGTLLAARDAPAEQTRTYSDLLRRLVDLDHLPYLVEEEECDQFSSYDRRSRYDEATEQYLDWSANGDSGNYIRYDAGAGEDVMAEMEGPGYINRIWSANPQGKIRFYLDDSDPIELDFSELFSGKVEPFRRPLVWQRRVVLGGNNPASNCYLPIPYQKSCKVTSVSTDKDKRIVQYYHIGYTSFPAGTKVPTFRLELSDKEKSVMEEVCGKLFNCGWDPQPMELFWGRKTIDLQPGQTAVLHEIEGPAIIYQIKGKLTTAAEKAIGRKVVLKVFWDDETNPSVWAPLGDFFGQSFGDSPYASLPLGMEIGNWYSYWRMPFGSRARFVVTSEAKRPCLATLDIGFRKVQELPPNTGYFHAKWRRERECKTFD